MVSLRPLLLVLLGVVATRPALAAPPPPTPPAPPPRPPVVYPSYGKYNLTKTLESTLAISFVHADDTAGCSVPGICTPKNVSVTGNTLWYWCGFKSTHRIRYKISTLTTKYNFTSFFMRRHDLEGCAFKNLTTADTCAVAAGLGCSKKDICEVEQFGLSFSNELCFVLINSKSSTYNVLVKVNNYNDSPRNWGTAFSIVNLILGALWVLYSLYRQVHDTYVAPPNKGHHQQPSHVRSIKVSPSQSPSTSLSGKAVPAIDVGLDASPTKAAGGGFAATWGYRMSHLLPGKRNAQAAAPASD